MFRFLKSVLGSRSQSSRVRPRSRPARLGLEGLEDRWCPSCTVGISRIGTLQITGTSAVNGVKIEQNDDANNLKVTCDGVVHNFLSSSIEKINVDLKGSGDNFYWDVLGTKFNFAKQADIKMGDGTDDAQFWMGGGLDGTAELIKSNLIIALDTGAHQDTLIGNFGRKFGGELSFTANMGSGNDSALASLWGDVSGHGSVKLEVQGGDGEDSLASWSAYDSFVGAYNSVDVSIECTAQIILKGGNHDDEIDAQYSGEVDGDLQILLDGEAGADEVTAKVYLKNGGNGSLDAQVRGGLNNDHLSFYLWEDAVSNVDLVNALIDGNDGFDFYHWLDSTDNVTVQNCEGIYPLFYPV